MRRKPVFRSFVATIGFKFVNPGPLLPKVSVSFIVYYKTN